MPMKVVPMFDQVLIRPEAAAETSKGGIVIPEHLQQMENIRKGEVIAAGKGTWTTSGAFIDTIIPVGTKVMFDRRNGTLIRADGEELYVVRQVDILVTYTETSILSAIGG